jgi:hypothetical protein
MKTRVFHDFFHKNIFFCLRIEKAFRQSPHARAREITLRVLDTPNRIRGGSKTDFLGGGGGHRFKDEQVLEYSG